RGYRAWQGLLAGALYGYGAHHALAVVLPVTCGSCLESDAPGHAVKPVADRILPAYRAGLAREHEKSGLECVLGVLLIAQHTPANPKHQGTMPFHQSCKRRLVAFVGKPLQQLAIARGVICAYTDEAAQMPQEQASLLVLLQARSPPGKP